jgi:hypothetical protein
MIIESLLVLGVIVLIGSLKGSLDNERIMRRHYEESLQHTNRELRLALERLEEMEA